MNQLIINGLFLSQRPTGVHRFAYEMCVALQNEHCDFIVVAPRRILRNHYAITFPLQQIGINSGHLWEQVDLPLFMSVHYRHTTLVSFTGLGPLFRKKHITTIHDVSFLVNHHWFSTAYYLFYKWATPIVAKHASHIITVSQFSKKEIASYLSVKTNKITVIYNAIANHFCVPASNNMSLPARPYMLAVSSHDPRKNFKRLIDAYLLSDITTHDLIIVGGSARTFANERWTEHPHIHLVGYVSDNELRDFYRHATLFIYPSLYEGFGIPPLEALAQGCPVLASNIEVLHEIYDNAITYCNPTNPNDIANKMRQCITHPLFNTTQVKRCLEQYSWKKSAQIFIQSFV